MRGVLAVALIVILGYCFAADPLLELQLGTNKFVVKETCLKNSLSLCSDNSVDHAAFASFTVTAKVISEVADKTDLWKAAHNKFSTTTADVKKQHVGADNTEDLKLPAAPSSVARKLLSSLPANFDARSKWSTCIGVIRNQGQCGSCWIFSSSSSLADRICIKTNQKLKNLLLSPQELVSCNGASGCKGGSASKFFSFTNSTGIVEEACLPYSSTNGATAACPANCKNNQPLKAATKFFTTQPLNYIGRDAIKTELFNNGPLTLYVAVYEDFFSYKSGIYHHVSGNFVGGHLVRLIGWGHDSATNTDFWLCANSWGNSWGDNGFFKIVMGDAQKETVSSASYTHE